METGTGEGTVTRAVAQKGRRRGWEGGRKNVGDEDGKVDGSEDEIKKGKGEARESKKLHKRCRRDHTFSFRTRHHLCRQAVALAGTR